LIDAGILLTRDGARSQKRDLYREINKKKKSNKKKNESYETKRKCIDTIQQRLDV